MALLDRFRRSTPAHAPRRALPPPGAIRRERALLAHAREEKIRDLGGLMLEMYRRDRFREDLVTGRCNELLALDARLHELDEMLAASRQRAPASRCECGAALPWGSQFCPACGRPVGEQDTSTCAECGRSVPHEARFCGACGAPAAAPASSDDGDHSGTVEQAGDGVG